MDITTFDPATDDDSLAAYVEVANAVRVVDAPWVHPVTPTRMRGGLTTGWDGEPTMPFLGTVDGEPVACGTLSTSEWDNTHLAWLGIEVHPEHRRRGHGSAMLAHLETQARERGRTLVGVDGWDSEVVLGFSGQRGFTLGSVSVNRRQHLAEVDVVEVRRSYDDARPHASAYDLVRTTGRTADTDLAAVAEMTMAINDAPVDDLDIEDEQYPPERIHAYEDAQLSRGFRLYRVTARHRETGALAGHSVVVVDGEQPERGEQHDTSVVGSHRGHRLGLLLKADMLLWLREAEPQLATVDTWNAESNDHMIGVNELLGYRVMARQLELQKKLV